MGLKSPTPRSGPAIETKSMGVGEEDDGGVDMKELAEDIEEGVTVTSLMAVVGLEVEGTIAAAVVADHR